MRRKFLIGVFSAMCALSMMGCSVSFNVPSKSDISSAVDSVVTKEDKEDTKEISAVEKGVEGKLVPEIKTELPERLKDTDEKKVEDTESEVATKEEEPEVEVVEDTKIESAGSWEDLKFKFDGVNFSIYDGISLSDFEAQGWYIADDSVGVLDANTYSIVLMNNDEYEKATLRLSIGNKTDSAISLSDGVVFGVDYCANYGFRLVDSYPSMNVCGINICSSINDVESALGSPSSTYESDNQDVYTYYGDGCSLKVAALKESGVCEFNLNWSAWSF